ncbi:MAG: hypothetical protein P4L84_36055 [Isosphaeraceae bacterium]|nr:hypothetical protein [Isosphaeraceae bacterium]
MKLQRDVEVGDVVRYLSPNGERSWWHKQVGRVIRDAGPAEFGRDRETRYFIVRFRRAPPLPGPRARPELTCAETELALVEAQKPEPVGTAPVKVFQQDEIHEAIAHAQAGGQALHLHRIIVDWKKAPACFRAAINRGDDIAHLFDQDIIRLRATARRLGVRTVVVEHPRTRGQHIDLCNLPLTKAKREAEEATLFEQTGDDSRGR